MTQQWSRIYTLDRVAQKVIHGTGNSSYATFEKLLVLDDAVPQFYTSIVQKAMSHITY